MSFDAGSEPVRVSPDQVPDGVRVVTVEEIFENIAAMMAGQPPTIESGNIAVKITSAADEFAMETLTEMFPGVFNSPTIDL